MAKVILEDIDYEKMVKEIQKLREEKAELVKANNFLNDQIREYKKDFVNDGK